MSTFSQSVLYFVMFFRWFCSCLIIIWLSQQSLIAKCLQIEAGNNGFIILMDLFAAKNTAIALHIQHICLYQKTINLYPPRIKTNFTLFRFLVSSSRGAKITILLHHSFVFPFSRVQFNRLLKLWLSVEFWCFNVLNFKF